MKTTAPNHIDAIGRYADRFTDEQRRDLCDAINVLMMEGKIDARTSYSFVIDGRGRERVMTWINGTKPGEFLRAPTYDDPREIIVSAGGLTKIRHTFSKARTIYSV